MKWHDLVGMLLLPAFLGFAVVRVAVSYFPSDETGTIILGMILLVVSLCFMFWRDYVTVKNWRNRNVNSK